MTRAKAAYTLKVTPSDAQAALGVLSHYIAERVAIIEARKITDLNVAVKMMDALFKFKEDLAKTVKSPTEGAYDTMRFTVIPQIMDGDGITNIGIEGVGRVHLQDDVSVKVEDKDGLKGWLIAHEKEDLITESVNAQTLAAFVRQRMKAVGEKPKDEEVRKANELPDSTIITVKPVVRAVITRG